MLRIETPADAVPIRDLTRRAFRGQPHSDGSEPAIIDRLRAANALTVSLVAADDHAIVGHIAISPVTWPGEGRWVGLGPVSVDPDHQGQGIGTALIQRALDDIRGQGYDGCVVLGDPAFYARLGFRNDPRFTYPGAPPEYFSALAFSPVKGSGPVQYAPAFG
jgi:putative acetyltransferase